MRAAASVAAVAGKRYRATLVILREGVFTMARWLVIAVTVASLPFAAPHARAADFAFDLGVEYSHLTLEGSQSFGERDGLRIEPRFSVGLTQAMPQLRLGVGVGFSSYYHQLDSDTVITIDHGDHTDVIFADQWESVSLIEPELQVSFRQTFGPSDRWYVEPGVGVGAAVANYSVWDNFWGWSDTHNSEWDTTWEVRPFLRIGYMWENWVAGFETSYMWGGNLDLTDQVRGDVREFYAGGYFGYHW